MARQKFPIPLPLASPGLSQSYHQIVLDGQVPAMVDRRGYRMKFCRAGLPIVAGLTSFSSFYDPNTGSRCFTTHIGRRTIKVSYLLLGMPPGLVAHHRNNDTTDNQLSNLEAVPERVNLAARVPAGTNQVKTGYSGITRFWWPDETVPGGGYYRLRASANGPHGQMTKRFPASRKGWKDAKAWRYKVRRGEEQKRTFVKRSNPRFLAGGLAAA
jgi:hypothetical protein